MKGNTGREGTPVLQWNDWPRRKDISAVLICITRTPLLHKDSFLLEWILSLTNPEKWKRGRSWSSYSATTSSAFLETQYGISLILPQAHVFNLFFCKKEEGMDESPMLGRFRVLVPEIRNEWTDFEVGWRPSCLPGFLFFITKNSNHFPFSSSIVPMIRPL